MKMSVDFPQFEKVAIVKLATFLVAGSVTRYLLKCSSAVV